MKKEILLLTAILIIAAFLRFFQLGLNPPSLTWDEAAWGYNAYSLGIDGRDEFGRFLPHDYLESFGDFKPPVYAYLDILPVKIFGLNEFAVRFPSAFFGVLTVVVSYFLVLRIFWNQKREAGNGKNIALLTSFILAISPWHVNLSRAAFEANVATFFLVAGVWLFLCGMREKKWCLLFSAIFFILSIYTFNTARIVAPLLLFFLAIGFRKQLLTRKKEVFIGIFVGIILILPIARFLLSPQASLRFKEVNIFSDISVVEKTNQEIRNDNNVWWSKILHNRRFYFAKEYLTHYFDNLSPGFLFIKGDGNPKFSTQDIGQLYLWELPFLILGILLLFKRKEGNWWIIPSWFILAIVPAAIARETPHALRIETALPTLQILTAYGMIYVFGQITKTRIKYLIFTILSLFLIFNFLYYYHGYYAHYIKQYSGEWQYGYKESISYIRSIEDRYDRIYFTESLGRPYIYFLFYTKYDPKEFRKNAVVEREVFGFVHVKEFGKYKFDGNVNSVKKKNGEKILYVDAPSRVLDNASIMNTFYLKNGEKALVVYTL